MEFDTIIKNNPTNPLSCPQARGLRVKSLRQMAGFSRNGLENKYGISAHTIQSWERGKSGGLTFKGAQRFLTIMAEEGILCSLEWLLHGIGNPAQIQTLGNHKNIPNYNTYPLYESITQELLVFRKHNLNTIDYIIQDDGMAPYYLPGDYVAGKKRVGSSIKKLIGMDCIVQTQSNQILFRRILKQVDNGIYDLSCTNIYTMISEYILYGYQLISAAPVIWHRRPEAME